MKIVFVASMIRNCLCIIYVFFYIIMFFLYYYFFQKSLFTENYFLIDAINLATRGPLYTCLVKIWYCLRLFTCDSFKSFVGFFIERCKLWFSIFFIFVIRHLPFIFISHSHFQPTSSNWRMCISKHYTPETSPQNEYQYQSNVQPVSRKYATVTRLSRKVWLSFRRMDI